MAYVSHSPYRAYRDTTTHRVDAGLVGRAALTALAAGAVIVALSGASNEAAVIHTLAKGDRIAAASVIDAAPSAGYVVDNTAQTTTIAKGAQTSFSADSAYIASAK